VGCDPKTSSEEVRSNVKQATQLFEVHGDYIRAIASLSLSDQTVIEDFCHDLFMYFVAKPIELENKKIRGLLYSIIKCRVRNWCRRVDNYKQRIQKYRDLKCQQEAAKPTQTIADVHDLSEVYKAIDSYLSETEATAVLLRYRDQHSVQETAQLMGVKTESVIRYVSVGLKKVRDQLKKKKEVEP
jgi:RNA polymerase sigma factor (sigma-70 family)